MVVVVVGALQQPVDEQTFMCLEEETSQPCLVENPSKRFEIPLAVCVCLGVWSLKHGIVNETPYCTEPPRLRGMNN